MRTIGFFALSTFLLSSIVTAQDYRPGEDNYSFKTVVGNETSHGFTIEYKKYYKVVTNLITSKRYCLVGWGQPTPEDCVEQNSFAVPVQQFSFEADVKSVGPFVELLGIQNRITAGIEVNSTTSPCVIEGSKIQKLKGPDLTFSNLDKMYHASFSGDSDTLGPLQKASWILYLGAFFDLEAQAYSIYNQIENDYECHRQNLGTIYSRKGISWTSYNPVSKTYTTNGDHYYDQLSQDAGATLITNNRLQDHTFNTDPVGLNLLVKALVSADIIIDTSDPKVNYSNWFDAGGLYFKPGSNFGVVKALDNKQVYTMHGLLNAHGASDWVQRSPARPDLALLDLIKLLYPKAIVAKENMFPLWLAPFESTERRTIEAASYGNCSSMATTAAEESLCYLGNGNSGTTHQPDLSSSGKAGISVGVVLFVLLTACVGTWLFRRHRRNQRHNFYRMNDLQSS